MPTLIPARREVDDLFGHEPLSNRIRSIFSDYAKKVLLAGHYDFHMGHKLHNYLSEAGFSISKAFTVEDQELSFNGPAAPGVLDAWRDRFERMALLRQFCGAAYPQIQHEFLACLASDNHKSIAKVHCCIATR